MIGKCSQFGGIADDGMKGDSGLALYEPHEADLRLDIFFPAPKEEPTWKRLRTYFPYIALRYDHAIPRKVLQNTPYKISNPKSGEFVVAFLVDWGPNQSTNRIVDCSPVILTRLGVTTDDEIEVLEMK